MTHAAKKGCQPCLTACGHETKYFECTENLKKLRQDEQEAYCLGLPPLGGICKWLKHADCNLFSLGSLVRIRLHHHFKDRSNERSFFARSEPDEERSSTKERCDWRWGIAAVIAQR